MNLRSDTVDIQAHARAIGTTPARKGVSDGSVQDRLEFLDALRGIAAMAVVAYHMALIPEPDLTAPRWLQLTVHMGGMGVTLFFVASAFSLFYTMPLRLSERRPVLSFYLHRLLRIAPLFYVWIALTLVRDWLYWGAVHSPTEVFASVLFAFNFIPGGQEGFVWASWTLGIEMVFYLMFPWLYFRTRNVWQALSWTMAAIILWQLTLLAFEYAGLEGAALIQARTFTFVRHLPIFGTGVVAYFVVLKLRERLSRDEAHPIGHCLLMLSLLLFTGLVWGRLPVLFVDEYYWQGVLFAVFLIGLSLSPVRLLVNRLTVYLGKVSYSLYLGHPTVVLLLGPVYANIYEVAGSNTLGFAGCLSVTLLVLLPLSELTFRWVEKPGIRLGKRLAQRVNRWPG